MTRKGCRRTLSVGSKAKQLLQSEAALADDWDRDVIRRAAKTAEVVETGPQSSSIYSSDQKIQGVNQRRLSRAQRHHTSGVILLQDIDGDFQIHVAIVLFLRKEAALNIDLNGWDDESRMREGGVSGRAEVHKLCF